jgi:hypothetical protein
MPIDPVALLCICLGIGVTLIVIGLISCYCGMHRHYKVEYGQRLVMHNVSRTGNDLLHVFMKGEPMFPIDEWDCIGQGPFKGIVPEGDTCPAPGELLLLDVGPIFFAGKQGGTCAGIEVVLVVCDWRASEVARMRRTKKDHVKRVIGLWAGGNLAALDESHFFSYTYAKGPLNDPKRLQIINEVLREFCVKVRTVAVYSYRPTENVV